MSKPGACRIGIHAKHIDKSSEFLLTFIKIRSPWTRRNARKRDFEQTARNKGTLYHPKIVLFAQRSINGRKQYTLLVQTYLEERDEKNEGYCLIVLYMYK